MVFGFNGGEMGVRWVAEKWVAAGGDGGEGAWHGGQIESPAEWHGGLVNWVVLLCKIGMTLVVWK